MKKGKLIAFFGADGTGKSTVSDIVDSLCIQHFISTRHYHWRPRFLPSRNVDLSRIDVTRPDELSERNRIISFITYIYFFCDFFIASIIQFSLFKKSGGIILYERYFYDILFHPRRYRTKEIGFLAEALAKIVPRPDCIVCFYGSPEIIHNRKPELSIDEISRQQELMRNYFSKYNETLFIDVTDITPQEASRRVFEVICPVEIAPNFEKAV